MPDFSLHKCKNQRFCLCDNTKLSKSTKNERKNIKIIIKAFAGSGRLRYNRIHKEQKIIFKKGSN